jgi:hypothetical protein
MVVTAAALLATTGLFATAACSSSGGSTGSTGTTSTSPPATAAGGDVAACRTITTILASAGGMLQSAAANGTAALQGDLGTVVDKLQQAEGQASSTALKTAIGGLVTDFQTLVSQVSGSATPDVSGITSAAAKLGQTCATVLGGGAPTSASS